MRQRCPWSFTWWISLAGGRNAGYPEVLEARPASILEVIEDEFERAKAAGLTGEDLKWHLARVIGGCKPAAAKAASACHGWNRPNL
jgi:hypothetical protein